MNKKDNEMKKKVSLIIMMSILLLAVLGGCQLDNAEKSPLAQVSSEMDALGVEKLSMNLTNDVHYKFVLETLEKAAKQNPEALTAIKDLNAARELALKGELPAAPSFETKANIPGLNVHDHIISGIASNPVAKTMTASAMTTVYGVYTFGNITVCIVDPNTQASLTDLGFSTMMQNGAFVAVCSGPLPNGGKPTIVEVVSIESIYANGVPYFNTLKARSIVGSTTLPGGNNWLIEEPTEHNYLDSRIVVCMDRGGIECDYPYYGDRTTRVPFKGYAETMYGYKVVSIDPANTWIKMVGPINGGTITMALVNTGLGTFKDQIKIADSASLSSLLSFNLARANTLFLHPDFDQVQYFDYMKRVDWIIQIKANVQSVAGGPAMPLTLSVSSQSNCPEYKPLYFKRSCIAAGSMVSMADGSKLPVEQVVLGDMVDANGTALKVVNISTGYEYIPMVRLVEKEAEGISDLLITTNHAVLTSKGLIMAGKLAAGDVVMTEDGPKTIALAAREMYTGKVYNLTVANPSGEPLDSLESQVFIANGFVIADGAIEHLIEKK